MVFRHLCFEVVEDQLARESAAFQAEVKPLKQASDRQKAKIEKRIAEVKAALEVGNAKLQEAGRLAKAALAVWRRA